MALLINKNLIRNESVRNAGFQILVIAIIVSLCTYLISNTLNNLERQDIATGFSYLRLEASFGISESIINYTPSDSYGRALIVGLLNTIKISSLSIIISTIIGVMIGITALSGNPLVFIASRIYIDLFRNIPLLLQLAFWYAFLTASLPSARDAWSPIHGFYLSNRGFFFPILDSDNLLSFFAIALIFSSIATNIVMRWLRRYRNRSGRQIPASSIIIFIWIMFFAAAYVVSGSPNEFDTPVLQGFNFSGGFRISPEFAAVLLGLTIYTSTFIAEIVRSGIEAVQKGQWEAAESLGLKRSFVLRFVILPQSLRVSVPPLTNQYLSLTKNSSLAMAVGYPDLVSVSNTTMNQTGQAIEAIAIFMSVYLLLSLFTSLFMNWFNSKVALVER